MTDNLKNDFLQKIEWRFYSYLVQYQLAKYDDDIIGKEVSANHNSVAYLSTLRVDRIAREKKKALLKAEIEYTKSISNELNQKVAEKMENVVNNESLIQKKYIEFPAIIFGLIEKLYMKSTSLSQLEFYINDISWLNRQLIDTLKHPYFSKQLQKSNRVKIDSLRSTLGILGEDNLKYFIPKYIVEQNIPKDSSFPLIGRKLFEHSLMTGTACFHLAKNSKLKINPYIAYTSGLFHELGAIILFRMYLDTFEQVWQEELKLARENIQQKRFNTISKIEPCRKHLRKMFFEHSRRFTGIVSKDFYFERLPLGKVLQRFCNRNSLDENGARDIISDYVDILEKANIYAEAEELFDVKLINEKNKAQLVLSKNITKEELVLLSSNNLKSFIEPN